MPISPAVSWSETVGTVSVTAQCRGATTKSTDVFSSPHYVSANAPPYFLELDLHGAIDSARSVATVKQGTVVLKLFKAEEGLWGRLSVDLPRADRLKRREASRSVAAQEAQAAQERKKRTEWDDSRFTLGKQMDKDRAEREKIDGYKAAEKAAEEAELQRWKQETETEGAADGTGWASMTKPIVSRAARQGGTDDLSKAAGMGATPMSHLSKHTERIKNRDAELKRKKGDAAKGLTKSEAAGDEITDDCGIVEITDDVPPLAKPGDAALVKPQIFDEDEDDAATVAAAPPPKKVLSSGDQTKAAAAAKAKAAAAAKAKEAKEKADQANEAAKAALPPPRSGAKVAVNFTKQLLTAPARTKTGNADYDLPLDPLTVPEMFKNKVDGDISQRDPAWLKDRGDRYFRLGDWRSAEEAYGLVLQQFAASIMGQAIDCVTACYSNRAACRLQTKQYLAAADDCGHALAITAKARCVTEYPKSEAAQARCRMRLLARRGCAYARAGVLHRALTDMRVAAGLADGPMPSDAADRQMLNSDAQAVASRHDEVISLLEKADKLLAEAQPAMAAAKATGDADDDDDDSGPKAILREARVFYDEAVRKAPLEVSALANRAACFLYLGEPSACAADCNTALAELDAEEHRTEEKQAEHKGMFAAPIPDKELTRLTDELMDKTPTLRFELLRRRAAARIDQGEGFYPQAAMDLKAALKLRPAEPMVVRSLDDLARRAAEAGVELEPLPPVLPPATGLAQADEEEEDEEEDEQEQECDGVEDGASPAATSGGDGGEAGAATPDDGDVTKAKKPAPPPKSAAELKADADEAFREARLGRAVTFYGKALKADAAAEWQGEGGGILFRCQCLANRSACHLKLGAFSDTVNDAGAAIAALGTGLLSQDQQTDADALLLKLLARRGMALCQLTRYDEAATDYARAVELDPENAQLKADLKLIEAARSK
jgi:tetratricopeptide (TPR) repeat protein